MAYCEVLIGPISDENGLHWPPEIIHLNAADTAALAQCGVVKVLENYSPESTEPEPVAGNGEGEVALIVNLNTAPLEDIMGLRHIGEAIAQKIIANRSYSGLEAARIASGLSEAKWADIEALLEV
jgi:hypothetical protein